MRRSCTHPGTACFSVERHATSAGVRQLGFPKAMASTTAPARKSSSTTKFELPHSESRRTGSKRVLTSDHDFHPRTVWPPRSCLAAADESHKRSFLAGSVPSPHAPQSVSRLPALGRKVQSLPRWVACNPGSEMGPPQNSSTLETPYSQRELSSAQ